MKARYQMPFMALILLLLLSLTVPIVMNTLMVQRFGGFDIAVFGQIIYNVATLFQPISTIALPVHYMGTHFEPVVYLLGFLWIPFSFFKLDPYLFLLIIQLTANLLILFFCKPLFHREHYRKNLGLLVTLVLAVTHWGFWSSNSFEFHPTTLGLSLFLSSLVLFHQKRLNASLGFMFLATLCGEMWLIIGPVTASCFWALYRKELSIAKSILTVFIAFFFSSALLAAYFLLKKDFFSLGETVSDFVADRYGFLGNSIIDVILSPILQPKLFWDTILSPTKARYLMDLISPFLILGCVALWVSSRHGLSKQQKRMYLLLLIAAAFIAPAPLLKVMLSNYEGYLSREVHYPADILPFLILIGYAIGDSIHFDRINSRVAGVFAGIAFAFGIYPFVTHFNQKWEALKNPGLLSVEMRKTLYSLDRELSVYTDNSNFSPILSSRNRFYGHFADAYIKPSQMPDILVLAWPPEHFNHGVVNSNSFRSSIRSLNETEILAEYRGSNTRYAIDGQVPISNWGQVTVWRRQDVLSLSTPGRSENVH